MRRSLSLALLSLICWPVLAHGALKPQEVPLFSWRAQVETVQGKKPEGKSFTFTLQTTKAASTADAWSPWVPFDLAAAQAATGPNSYPNMYMGGFPLVLHCEVGGVVDPTVVHLEVRFNDQKTVQAIHGELFGPTLGVMIWRDTAGQHAPHAASMAEYNHRYWKVLTGVEIPAAERPHHFPIVDRFIAGDTEYADWREGLQQLSHAGFNGLMMAPDAKSRQFLLDVGQTSVAWAVYAPQDSMFDLGPKITPEGTTAWAKAQAEPYLKVGYKPQDMLIYHISDEPGWYYPSAFKEVTGRPADLAKFRDYLKAQKLSPADLGAADWEHVQPLGRSHAKDLPSRRLFYWTMRFFAWDSAEHFARSTAALQAAFDPHVNIVTNWNFFSGREYVPGPVANNADKKAPDAAMGGQDWFEFARLRGGTMLWTEDWFGDAQASQWSFYTAKFRSAAALGGIEFGGYVVPRTAGDRPDGIVQKDLAVVGAGGKAIEYFVFGPEYNFPGNCYSENVKVLPEMAHAHKLIGAAEELLWPGRPVQPRVAILMPRSSEMWDAQNISIPNEIQDATNTNMTAATTDYMAELFGLYTALQHANIPCNFVDEDGLTADGLKGTDVLYVTEPDIPAEGQAALLAWVKGGGHLVTVDGAAQRDRYDQPCTILRDALGVSEAARPAMLVASVDKLEKVGDVRIHAEQAEALAPLPPGAGGPVKAIGARSQFTGSVPPSVQNPALTFLDAKPALLERAVGKGRFYHFPWLPGVSYLHESNRPGLPGHAHWSAALRYIITAVVPSAGVPRMVQADRPFVETPILTSEKGAVVTVLNWTGEPIGKLELTLHLPFTPKRAVSAEHGELKMEAGDGGAFRVQLPVKAADFVSLYRE